MSAEAAERKTWTPEEYLAWERTSELKHELFQGEVFAMAGASREHNLIVSNAIRVLGNALLDRPCEVYPSDLRVKIQATGLYTYPDASVVCGRPEFEDNVADTLLNPNVIFEVLSESTEGYDRGKKFRQYRTITSLRDYVLVAQDTIQVEHFRRKADGSWSLREAGAGGRLALESIGCDLAVDELYRKVFDREGLPPSA